MKKDYDARGFDGESEQGQDTKFKNLRLGFVFLSSRRAAVFALSRASMPPNHSSYTIPELCGAGDDVARQQLYDAIDSIRDSLSDFDDRPLVKTEGLYLDYPLGGFFKRHIDAAPPGLGLDQEWRRYSYLLYLNDVQRGGELRLYTDDDFVEVQPRAGTLVVFRSDLIEHEALETRQPRVAVAGWFSRRESGWRAALLRRLGFIRSQN